MHGSIPPYYPPRDVLTPEERSRFETYKRAIHDGIEAWSKAAEALIKIRDERLYREDYPTFEQFVNLEFKISVRRSYQLIEAFQIMMDLSTDHVLVLPNSERLIRELVKYPKKDRKKIYQLACQKAALPGRKVTRKLLEEAAKDFATKRKVTEHWFEDLLKKLQQARKLLTFSADFSSLNEEQKHAIGLELARIWDATESHVRSLKETGHIPDLEEGRDVNEEEAEKEEKEKEEP